MNSVTRGSGQSSTVQTPITRTAAARGTFVSNLNSIWLNSKGSVEIDVCDKTIAAPIKM